MILVQTVNHYVGSSTETKPTRDSEEHDAKPIPVGSTFFALDDRTDWIFGPNEEWVEIHPTEPDERLLDTVQQMKATLDEIAPLARELLDKL